MTVVTITQLYTKDVAAISAIRNLLKAQYPFVAFDWMTCAAVAEHLYNKFKDKHHHIIYKGYINYDGKVKPFNIRVNYE